MPYSVMGKFIYQIFNYHNLLRTKLLVIISLNSRRCPQYMYATLR